MKLTFITELFSSLAIASLLIGCSQDTGYVWHDGPINKESVSKTIERMEGLPNLGTFYISSGGGDSDEGKRLGKYLISRNIKVVVIGNCYSACANYVFLSAKNRGMTKWAKIGMHGGSRSFLIHRIENLKNVPPNFMDAYIAGIKSNLVSADIETKLLIQAGINPEIIEKSARETLQGAIDIIIERDGAQDNLLIPEKINTKYGLWFPKKQNYKDWGINTNEIVESKLPTEIRDRFFNFTDSFEISDAP